MGFFVFMFIMCIFIPAIMILFGALFKKRAPGKINMLFGYRTARSMKSEESWEFAHRKLGRIWLILGIITLVVSAAVMLFAAGGDKDEVGRTGTALIYGELAVMLLSIIPVEAALRKNFDKDGKRKTLQ